MTELLSSNQRAPGELLRLMDDHFDAYMISAQTVNSLVREFVGEHKRLLASTAIVGELAALIPLSETVEATRTGATMIAWFKAHLRTADEPSAVHAHRWVKHDPALPLSNGVLHTHSCDGCDAMLVTPPVKP
jgi:hypothetical protein